MSQENVELIRKVIPPAGTDYTTLFRDDAVWGTIKNAIEPLVEPDFGGAFIALGHHLMDFTGLDEMREAWIQWLAPWSEYQDEIDDVFAVGDDRVLVLGREHGYRVDVGAEVAAESAGVYIVREGRILRVEYHAKQAEALKAAGLSG